MQALLSPKALRLQVFWLIGRILSKINCKTQIKISVDEPAIAHALQYLTPHKRDVLLLYYFHGETDAEIGKRMKQTESAVFRRRIAALQRLKEIMEDLNDEA